MAKTATLTIDGKSYTFPIVEGSEGEQGIDISNLLESTGTVTLDFGYKNTGATTSAITFLDGDKGILRYRGYSIEDLAAKSTFLEVCYLLIFGELPTTDQLNTFSTTFRTILWFMKI
jgi:citrate synthase